MISNLTMLDHIYNYTANIGSCKLVNHTIISLKIVVTFENAYYRHQKSRKMKVEASAKIHRNWSNVKTKKCKSTLFRNKLRTEKLLTNKFSASI